METLHDVIEKMIKKRIKILAKLKLKTDAKITNYIETKKCVYGRITYHNKQNKEENLGFKYEIKKDELKFMYLLHMINELYYTLYNEILK